MNENQQEPKTNGIEVFIILMICFMIDIVGFFGTILDAAFGAGEFIKFFIDLVASALIFFWATMKGMRSLWVIAGSIMELLPFINVLPLYTITMGIALYLDHHPKEAAVAQTATRVINPKRTAVAPTPPKKTTQLV